MRRGTQGHMAAPRGPAQRLCGALYLYYIYYYYIYKEVFSLAYMGRVIDSSYSSGIINPTKAFNISRVGLIHTVFDKCR